MSPAARRTRPEVVTAESRLRAASERMTLMRAFGQRLRELRLAAGLTRRQLARKGCISQSTISKAELGRSEPSLSLILILGAALSITPGTLIGGLPAPQQRRT